MRSIAVPFFLFALSSANAMEKPPTEDSVASGLGTLLAVMETCPSWRLNYEKLSIFADAGLIRDEKEFVSLVEQWRLFSIYRFGQYHELEVAGCEVAERIYGPSGSFWQNMLVEIR